MFLFDLFHLVTWDDLDLFYGHKAQEMILTDVSDTIHADSLALFALNIYILLADVAKPEKSKILSLTWPVTSSVTSGSNFWPCTGSSRTGPGALCPPPPPPAGRVTNQTPAGRGILLTHLVATKLCGKPCSKCAIQCRARETMPLSGGRSYGDNDLHYFSRVIFLTTVRWKKTGCYLERSAST